MTPDKARALLDGTTPGPWEVETVPEMRYYDGETWETPGKIVVYADEATLFVATDEFVGDEGDEHDNEKNVRLAAAAPALAAMIAGMREEWGVHVTGYPKNIADWAEICDGPTDSTAWFADEEAAEDFAVEREDEGFDTRIVRRYVTTPEEA